MRLAFLALLLAAATPALAQSAKSDPPLVDFKPLVSPLLPPLTLPPNSYLTPGAIGGVTPSPYTTPFPDQGPSRLPAPGLRLTIPTR